MKNIKTLLKTICLSLVLTTLFLNTFAMERHSTEIMPTMPENQELKAQVIDVLLHHTKQPITLLNNVYPGNEYSHKVEEVTKNLFGLIRHHGMQLSNKALDDLFFENFYRISGDTCLKRFYSCIPGWEAVYQYFVEENRPFSREEIRVIIAFFLQNTEVKQRLLNPFTDPIEAITKSVSDSLKKHGLAVLADEIFREYISTRSELDIKNFNGYEALFLDYLTETTFHDFNHRLTQDATLESFLNRFYSPLYERKEMIIGIMRASGYRDCNLFRMF